MTAAPLQFLLLMFAGWVNRNQLDLIGYLKEENRILRDSSAAGGCSSRTTSAAGLRRRAESWADECSTNLPGW